MLFSKRDYLLLCVESLSLPTNPVSSCISHLLGLSQDGHTMAFTELRMCQFGEESRDRIKDNARRKFSSWCMCECLEFCWGWREVRGRDWRLDLMEHWSDLYGNHLGYFYPWLITPASEPRLVSMANLVWWSQTAKLMEDIRYPRVLECSWCVRQRWGLASQSPCPLPLIQSALNRSFTRTESVNFNELFRNVHLFSGKISLVSQRVCRPQGSPQYYVSEFS